MNIPDFLKTIYLGDRACQSILIDGWRAEVKMQVSCISRIRSAQWDYYTDEDLPAGFLVFEGVRSIVFRPAGVIPNDTINAVEAEPLPDENAGHRIRLHIDAIDANGERTEVEVCIDAAAMALEDAARPGERIVE